MEVANKNKILEALSMQPLSEDEKNRRHILGRLYGPIATCKESTRNGRRYNKELWEKALADDIFKEKLATKSLFLELGHPADREETDMKMVCACIPEMPKIVNDDLYAYVDILDTPNGKLLKTFCDYGFIPGISSRGSGDIMANDEVDPDTFFLETWDIVALPAVKKARLAMCESLNHEKPLKAVLQESYDAASDEDKTVMKEALENLDIKLTESENIIETPENVDDIPVAPENESLTEETEEEVENTEETPVEEAEEALTVGDFIDELKDYDKELSLEWKPIVINDVEYPVTAIAFDNTEDGKVIAEVNYNLPEVDDNTEVSSEEPVTADEVPAEEAGDAGDDGVIESLKEAVNQKNALENEVRDLKTQKTVSDAKVNELNEELEKYKTGFIRVSEVASKSTSLEKENKQLTEQIEKKDAEIKDLQSKVAANVKLTESVNNNANQVKVLTEKLNKAYHDSEQTEKALNEQLANCKKQLSESAKLVNAYKAKTAAVLNHYIDSKAKMLGVRASDIVSKLNENYTLVDIDKVCDDILTSTTNYNSGLPFGNVVGKAKINEQVTRKVTDPDNGYDIDDDLLELAGLK